jgi:hypothetical protein
MYNLGWQSRYSTLRTLFPTKGDSMPPDLEHTHEFHFISEMV